MWATSTCPSHTWRASRCSWASRRAAQHATRKILHALRTSVVASAVGHPGAANRHGSCSSLQGAACPGCDADAAFVQDIAVSSGSACTSASLEPSYVLRALGVGDEMAHSSLRFGLGRFTTAEEVDRAVALTVQHVEKLRDMSPLWEMVQEGIDLKSISWSQH